VILFNLSFSDPKVAIVNIVILFILLSCTWSGYKKGFFESAIRLLGLLVAIVFAYLLKNPISVFLYTHLPFFKFKGIFGGVSILNILVYEALAFLIVFIILRIIINIVAKITGLVDRLLSVIFFLGIPGKILGAIVGLIKGIVILYFSIFVFKISCNIWGLEINYAYATLIAVLLSCASQIGDLSASSIPLVIH